MFDWTYLFVLLVIVNIILIAFFWHRYKFVYKLSYVAALASTQTLVVMANTNDLVRKQTELPQNTGKEDLYN